MGSGLISRNNVPTGRGLATAPMDDIELVNAVAPEHPLARLPDPISDETLRVHRATVVRDTARSEPKMARGVRTVQPALIVADFEAKCAAQLCGLGVGALPRYLIADDIEAGRLIHKPFAKPYDETIQLAWRLENKGKPLTSLRDEILTVPAPWLVRAN